MKRKIPMPTYYGKNIAQHAQRRFLRRKKQTAEQQQTDKTTGKNIINAVE